MYIISYWFCQEYYLFKFRNKISVPETKKSAVLKNLGNDFLDYTLVIINRHLACSYSIVPPTAIFQHEFSDIGLACSVYNAVAAGNNNVLFVFPPHQPDLDTLVKINCIYKETVAVKDYILFKKVSYY